jgi:NADH-quinone oxidoreductase chain I
MNRIFDLLEMSTQTPITKPPESFLRKLSKVLLPLWGVRAGLYITLQTLFRKKYTVQYPEQKVHVDPTFRGKISLLFAPRTHADICISCLQCRKICPVECIHIIPKVGEDKKRHVGVFDVDLNKCLFCAMCEEICPESCIVLDPIYDYSSYSHDGLYLTVVGLSREATEEEWRAMQDEKDRKKRELEARKAKKAEGPMGESKGDDD